MLCTTNRLRPIVPLVLLVICGVAEAASTKEAEPVSAQVDATATTSELKQRVRDTPEDHVARVLLGKAYLAGGKADRAGAEFQRALRDGAEKSEVIPLLVSSLVMNSRLDQAVELIDDPEHFAAIPEAERLALRGDIYARGGDASAARTAYERAAAMDPYSSRATLGLARLALGSGDLAEARRLVTQIPENSPQYPDAMGTLGRVKFRSEDFKEAAAAYKKALKSKPGDIQLHYERAVALLETRNPERARADTNAVAAINNRFAGLHYLRGRLSLLRHQPERALQQLNKYLAVHPEDDKAKYYAALALHQLGSQFQAEEYLRRIDPAEAGDAAPVVLLARIRLVQGDTSGAISLLDPLVRNGHDDIETVRVMHDALRREGLLEDAHHLLERAADNHQQDPWLQTKYAESLAQNDDTEQAIRVLRKAIDATEEFIEAREMIVDLMLEVGSIDEARQQADALFGIAPSAPVSHFTDGKVRAASNDTEGARRAFEQALQLVSDNQGSAAISLALAELERSDGNTKEARHLIEDLLAREPENTAAVLALAELARDSASADAETLNQEAQKRVSEAAYAAEIKRALARSPRNLALRLHLAEMHIAAGQAGDALELLSQAGSEQRSKPEVLMLSAHAEAMMGHAERARHTLARLAELQPNSAEVRYVQARVAAEAGDSRSTRIHLEEGLALERQPIALTPDSLTEILTQPAIEADREEILARLLRISATSPALRIVAARFAMQRRDYASAIAILEQLYQERPDDGVAVFEFARALQGAGRSGEAQRSLNTWLRAHPGTAEHYNLIADLQLSDGNQTGAEQAYLAALKLDHDSPRTLLALAELTTTTRPDEARAYAERALAQPTQDPNLQTTAAIVMLQLGETTKARHLLEEAQTRSHDPTIAFQYARVLALTGETAAARRILRTLQLRAFPEQQEAQQLFQTLSNPE